jgi:hypothetical protein
LKIAESKANNRITSFHSHAKPWRRTRIFRSSFLQGNKLGGHLIVIGSAANLAQPVSDGIFAAPSTKIQGMVGNPPIFGVEPSRNLCDCVQPRGGRDAVDGALPGNGLPSNHEWDVGMIMIVGS